MNIDIPDFITHYSRGEPFLSMSGVPAKRRAEILNGLNETNSWGRGRFSDSEYMDRRVEVEQRIRKEFLAKGGKPELDHPIYFFLGRNSEFERHELNKAHLIRIKDLPKDVVSFTYGDSMFSLNEDYRALKGGGYLSELCPHVYAVDDLPLLFSHPDFQLPTRLHVEAQLWIAPPR